MIKAFVNLKIMYASSESVHDKTHDKTVRFVWTDDEIFSTHSIRDAALSILATNRVRFDRLRQPSASSSASSASSPSLYDPRPRPHCRRRHCPPPTSPTSCAGRPRQCARSQRRRSTPHHRHSSRLSPHWLLVSIGPATPVLPIAITSNLDKTQQLRQIRLKVFVHASPGSCASRGVLVQRLLISNANECELRRDELRHDGLRSTIRIVTKRLRSTIASF